MSPEIEIAFDILARNINNLFESQKEDIEHIQYNIELLKGINVGLWELKSAVYKLIEAQTEAQSESQ